MSTLHYKGDYTAVHNDDEEEIGRFWKIGKSYAYKSVTGEGTLPNSYQCVDAIRKAYKESVIHD